MNKRFFKQKLQIKMFDDCGNQIISIKEESPIKLKKKFNSIFNKFL